MSGGPKFTARADGDLVRLVIVVTGETFQSLSLTQAEARSLRDALTLSLAPVAAGEPRLPCRITKGRKACRSCGAVSGQAHAEGCSEIVTVWAEEGERRVGPPERRAGAVVLTDLRGDTRTLLTYRGTVRGTMQSGPPSVDNLPRRDPPTPEEKAAGEWAGEYRVAADPSRVEPTAIHAAPLDGRIKYPPIEPLASKGYNSPTYYCCVECIFILPAHAPGCSRA